MEKKPHFKDKRGFSMLSILMKEGNIHISLICFVRNFNHQYINIVTFVPRKQSKKPQLFPQKRGFLLKKSFTSSAVMFVLTFLSK